MATRSLIAKQNADLSYEAVYCHFDGYPKGVGLVLKEHYLQSSKVDRLIEGGDMSYLAKTIEETEFYTQRGEEHHSYKNVPNLLALKAIAKNVGGEYLYIYSEQNQDWDCHMIM